MNGLIKVNFDSEQPMVSARELHDALDIKTDYRHWLPRVCAYGFEEGRDFNPVIFDRVQFENERTVKREITDHMMSIDMAKQVCMLQKTEKGMAYRRYFLELERAWNKPERVMARALQLANRTVEQLKNECRMLGGQVEVQQRLIAELEPKAQYLDEILHSEKSLLATQVAKDYGMSAQTFNKLLYSLKIQYKAAEQWVLYAKHQDKGYTCSTVFEIKCRNGGKIIRMQTEWTQKGRLFLYNELKKHGILPMIEKEGGNHAGGGN